MKRFTVTVFLLLVFCLLKIQAQRADSVFVKYLQDTGITITENNAVTLLPNGEEKFRDMFSAIKQAKSSVH